MKEYFRSSKYIAFGHGNSPTVRDIVVDTLIDCTFFYHAPENADRVKGVNKTHQVTRTEKTVNGTPAKYSLIGDSMTWKKTEPERSSIISTILPVNSEDGKYTDGNTYFYVRNAADDIIKIIDGANVVIEYNYDVCIFDNLVGGVSIKR